ncbi:MAG: SIR2 family protein [Pseudomonadota bacterium]
MRFIADGPSIPSHLLEQQALGNVIFFCGAGVSRPAGLDDFWGLTNRIIESLDAREAHKALDDGEEFDRVFNMLVKGFGRDEIDHQIYEALGQRRPRTLKNHRAILELSKGAGGTPQVVTTNFDHLFEKADRKVRPIVPPALPDIELRQPIDGVVYLHGRLVDRKNRDERASYVISSADFGRAYLAEGWAAKFIRHLRENYTVVFLGYSANDPPMRYLLEGLNNREGVAYDNPIYAFDKLGDEEAGEIWQDRGVTPVWYHADKTHSALWSSIQAWAEASASPDAWTNSVLELAQQSPSSLTPFERGQVVQLVNTAKGAKTFADAEPPISSQWMGVFDAHVRYGKPRKASWEEGAEEIDPLTLFGLDSDLPRPSNDDKTFFPEGTISPLNWRMGDGSFPERQSLLGIDPLRGNPLPDRMHHIARWFGKVCHEPAAIWWAAGWKSLNPQMLWFVSNRIRSRQGNSMPEKAQTFWNFYLDAVESTSYEDREYRWFDFEGLVRQAGWSPAAIRFFERCAQPFVEASRGTLAKPSPPSGDWDELRLRDAIELKVRVLDRHNHDIEIPDEQLPKIISIVRNSLVRMMELLTEVDDPFWHAPNLHPSEGRGETYHGKKEQLVIWFTMLIARLLKAEPAKAKQEFSAWPIGESRLFPKLKLWTAYHKEHFSASEAFEVFQSIAKDELWDSYNRRELLFLLKNHWPDFSKTQKRKIETYLEAGPSRWEDEDDEHFKKRAAANSASMLRWLELKGCELSATAKKALAKLKVVDERWSDKWAEAADESLGPRTGWVSEITETLGLEDLPLSELLEEAKNRSGERGEDFSRFVPFRGLVETQPFKALSALRLGLKNDDFPVSFWTDLLSYWPDGTSMRLRRLLAHTIANLQNEQAIELRYYAPDWLKKQIRALYRKSRLDALKIFDGFLRPFLECDAEKTKSGMGTSSIGGVVQERSEFSVNKTINSPVGKLTEVLWRLTAHKAKKLGRPNRNLEDRFAKLTSVAGNGAGHAVTTLTMRLGWIEYCYSDWANSFILPMFDLDHPLSEAAWHGFAYNDNALPPAVLLRLKPLWIAILKQEAPWNLDPEERRVLIQSMIWLSNTSRKEEPIFEFNEVRDILRELDDEGRGKALWALSNVLQKHDCWEAFVKPFIDSAWPKHLKYKSDTTSRGFVHIAEKSKQHFPDAVATILPFVRSVPHADMFTYRISRDRDDEENIAKDHPHDALILLNAITPDDRVRLPYELSSALEALAELDPSLRETSEFRRLQGLLD